MSDSTRTFFAIEVPEKLGQQLHQVQWALTEEVARIRWGSSNEPFHITLAFLGEVRNSDLSGLHELVAGGVARFDPLELQFVGLGAFPSAKRPRVLWAGLTARSPARFDEVRKAVAAATAKAGYPCDDDRFHPHVTLGRFKPSRHGPCDITAVVERYRTWSCGEFTASEIIGFASRPGADGPRYEVLSRGRLQGQKSPPLP